MVTVITFLVFLALFAGVGVASIIRSKGTTEDYLLAGQDVSPIMVAASAFASNFSGYMFIGVIGFVYANGGAAGDDGGVGGLCGDGGCEVEVEATSYDGSTESIFLTVIPAAEEQVRISLFSS